MPPTNNGNKWNDAIDYHGQNNDYNNDLPLLDDEFGGQLLLSSQVEKVSNGLVRQKRN